MLSKSVVSLRLSEEKIASIDKAVRDFRFLSRTDLIEKAVDHFLSEVEGTEIRQVRPISVKQAQKEIIEYAKGKRSVLLSELVDALGLDLMTAHKAVEELMRQGRMS